MQDSNLVTMWLRRRRTTFRLETTTSSPARPSLLPASWGWVRWKPEYYEIPMIEHMAYIFSAPGVYYWTLNSSPYAPLSLDHLKDTKYPFHCLYCRSDWTFSSYLCIYLMFSCQIIQLRRRRNAGFQDEQNPPIWIIFYPEEVWNGSRSKTELRSSNPNSLQ